MKKYRKYKGKNALFHVFAYLAIKLSYHHTIYDLHLQACIQPLCGFFHFERPLKARRYYLILT